MVALDTCFCSVLWLNFGIEDKPGSLGGRANRDNGCDQWVRQIDRVAGFRAVSGMEIVK
jgi:hypothetical protein